MPAQKGKTSISLVNAFSYQLNLIQYIVFDKR